MDFTIESQSVSNVKLLGVNRDVELNFNHHITMTMTMTMTTLLLNINTGYKLEYTYNMIY